MDTLETAVKAILKAQYPTLTFLGIETEEEVTFVFCDDLEADVDEGEWVFAVVDLADGSIDLEQIK